jgi:hypothetical protein
MIVLVCSIFTAANERQQTKTPHHREGDRSAPSGTISFTLAINA